MRLRILPTHTPELFDAAVEAAAKWLEQGNLAALPTETVYGLAANALDPQAVRKIFEAKNRPAQNPVIVHVASVEMARQCVNIWPEIAEKLAAAFWPGPLTLVLPKSDRIPAVVTADGPTVGVRWPSHPLMQAVIRRCRFPLAAPSANPANELSPTNAAHVAKTLGEKVQLVVDGGQSQVGIESTVLDLSTPSPRILRPGMISLHNLRAVLPEIREAGQHAAGPLKSPGQLPRHYAPRARLHVLSWRSDDELLAKSAQAGLAPVDTQIVAHTHIPSPAPWAGVSVIPHDAEAFARALYSELHRCDDAGAKAIIVESLPEDPVWDGIRDRLNRGAANEQGRQ